MGRAKEAASSVKEKAQEKIVVMGGYSPGLSLKWILILFIVAFCAGMFTGVRWDFSRFESFRAKMAKLERENEIKNKALESELKLLRLKLAREELELTSGDQTFIDIINRPSANQCRVPVEPINSIIEESGR